MKPGPRTSPSARWISKVILAITSLALVPLVLFACEIGLRYLTPDYLREISFNDLNYLHTYSEDYGWDLKPEFSSVLRGQRVRVNDSGFRGQSYPLVKASPVQRVVLLGDSIAFGYGVGDEETFGWLLDDTRVELEVINLAVQGYGTDQALIRMRKRAFEFDPDVIVLTFCVFNDFGDNVRGRFKDDETYPKPFFVYENGVLRKRSAHLELNPIERLVFLMSQKSLVYNRLLDLFGIDRRAHRSNLVRHVPENRLEDGNAFELTLRLIREMDRESRARGVRFIVLAFPDFPTYRPNARLLVRMQESWLLRDVEFVNIYDEFARLGYGRRRFDEVALDSIMHLSPLGHELTARVLADRLDSPIVPQD